MDEEDKDLDQSLEGDADLDGDSGSDNSAPQGDASTGGDKGDKRVRDLMSNWQREQSRANRLQAELDALKGGKPAEGSQDGSADGDAQSGNEFLEFAREDARRRIFEQDPRLAAYGLSASAIAGSTLDEMKASFAAQKKLIDRIASQARSEALQEHGLSPEVIAGASETAKGFAEMSQDEFKKLLAQREEAKYK